MERCGCSADACAANFGLQADLRDASLESPCAVLLSYVVAVTKNMNPTYRAENVELNFEIHED